MEAGDLDTENASVSDAAPSRDFRIIYQKVFPFPARHDLIAWSPQLDLLAVVTDNGNVLLYRMNGQRVWGITYKPGNGGVERLQWRPDGKMLALGYNDGSTRIYDVNNGKAIHQIVSESPEFGRVTCMGWADNHSHASRHNQPLDAKSAECTPQALFDLDIGSMLPRLSVLPPSSGPESTFTSKTTLDALINTVAKGGEGSHLDVLLIGEEGGKVILNVFESFLIGTMELSSLCHQLKRGSTLLRHTASPNLSTHSLLISEYKTGNLLFSTMDILFIEQFGQYLFQLASTSTRVQALIRYMRETVTSIATEFKSMNDIAQRYISIVDEDLEKVGSEAALEFYEFLVTGVPSPTLKEWLVDVLTERGQKRWEKSSLAGYEMLRRLVHESLLPTCERLVVLFSRLRGLARWKESGSPLGLEPDDFTRCLEVVGGINLYAHEFLQGINNELDHYKAFINWLRYSLDQISTVINIDDNKPTEDPQVDVLKVADYISQYLKKSSLESYLKSDTATKLSDYKNRGESIFELYSKDSKSKNVPGLMELAEYLDELCKTVFSKPQAAMRQQLRISNPLLLSPEKLEIVEMRMVKNDQAYICVFPGKDKGGFFYMISCEIAISGGLSSSSKVGCAKIQLPDETFIADLKFVDHKMIIVIVQDLVTKDTEVVTVDFTELEYDSGFQLPKSSKSIYSHATSLKAQELIAVSRRTFDSSWVPRQVAVNGKLDRRVGCLIAADSMKYIIFDMDHSEEDVEAAEAADDTMEYEEYEEEEYDEYEEEEEE